MCFFFFFILEENVVFNKLVWQKYLVNNLEKFGVEWVVDGLYLELFFYGGQCIMLEYGYLIVIWYVDLGKVYKIVYIVMYFFYESKLFF